MQMQKPYILVKKQTKAGFFVLVHAVLELRQCWVTQKQNEVQNEVKFVSLLRVSLE